MLRGSIPISFSSREFYVDLNLSAGHARTWAKAFYIQLVWPR